ncbi:BREX system Lon protease-like protein BrxL [Pseudorhodobacter aquimaris]|uniref:BREX system Lon protease-like protein BrxL n=1 Tax=Pseudorhodobacter aquimaris TaxID=687412 RepID=UPI0022B68B7E|nr:BREX system Lon protease-like protein BrxL [Pseudorhodobacter aquimaris]
MKPFRTTSIPRGEPSVSQSGDCRGRLFSNEFSLQRVAPLVEPNYNYIELGPCGTAKSYFFSEFSPYATLISGGQATKATLFYNNARRKVGLVGYWDTVAFDEIGGIKG